MIEVLIVVAIITLVSAGVAVAVLPYWEKTRVKTAWSNARKKPLKEVAVDSLGVDLAPKLKIKTLKAPEKRQAGRKVGSVEELVAVLHTEAKVI